jgi:hypothetical protein
MRLILIWIFNAIALLAVAYLLPGIRVDGFISALIAALVLGLINTLLRPLTNSAYPASHRFIAWPVHPGNKRFTVLVCRFSAKRFRSQ